MITNSVMINFFRSGLCSGNGKVRVFNFNHTYNNVIFTNLGKKNLGVNELEEIDEGKENIRSASASQY